MEPSVLAGPVEFSPAEIAFILAVLAAAFVVVTAPGWAVLGYATHRRRRALGRRGGWHVVLGCAVGLVVSFGTASVVAAMLGGANPVLSVPAAWVACWGLAWVWLRSARRVSPPEPQATPAPGQQGWGR